MNISAGVFGGDWTGLGGGKQPGKNPLPDWQRIKPPKPPKPDAGPEDTGRDASPVDGGRKGPKGPPQDQKFYGHSKVNKQNIVKNPPKQVPQLGKDGFYSNVKNRTGQL